MDGWGQCQCQSGMHARDEMDGWMGSVSVSVRDMHARRAFVFYPIDPTPTSTATTTTKPTHPPTVRSTHPKKHKNHPTPTPPTH